METPRCIIDNEMSRMIEKGVIEVVTRLRSACYRGKIIVLCANGGAGFPCCEQWGVDMILGKPVKLWQLGVSISGESVVP